MILRHDDIMGYFKYCARYQSEPIDSWSAKTREISILLLYLLTGCEEANNYKTGFDYKQFATEVTNFIEYYNQVTLRQAFVQDHGDFGLEKSVESIANEGLPSKETRVKLGQLFNYFDWDVLFYTDEFVGEEQHWILTEPDSVYCGSRLCGNNLFVEIDSMYIARIQDCFN
ncbi:unnamed protein product [Rotaria sp. Silwood1]|nr:unnamed protein product [Rotaria sp. Silwood1]